MLFHWYGIKNWKMGPGLSTFMHSQNYLGCLPPRFLTLSHFHIFVSRIRYYLEARTAYMEKFWVLLGNILYSSAELNNVDILIKININLAWHWLHVFNATSAKLETKESGLFLGGVSKKKELCSSPVQLVAVRQRKYKAMRSDCWLNWSQTERKH